ncbi:hypothetical protein FRC10_002697 [Ceratobasidium sp. 414]|nr:hypothetical protein FRC10_002697 [Ceratobasidium sp. 414]
MARTSANQTPPRRTPRSQSAATQQLGSHADNRIGSMGAPPVNGVMPDRCDPCKARGPHSKCDKKWPVCRTCAKESTQAGCFRGPVWSPSPRAEPPLTLRAPLHALLTPLCRSATPDPVLPLPLHPASTVRRRGGNSSMSSRHTSPGRGPIRLPVGARQRSPAPIEARIRASPFVDVNEERRGFAAIIEEMEAVIAQARARIEISAAPQSGKSPFAPANQPRGPLAIGVVAKANYFFVPQNVIDFARKSNGTTYISLCYFSEAYSRQSSTHGPLTTYHTRIDTTTSENIIQAVPLPDLGEARMSYAEYSGAFHRFISVLEALGDPLVDRWRLHVAHVHRRPEVVLDWPLVLSYCITIRRRSVYDHALDPGTFQSKIFEDCRAKYQEQYS